jgi:hypothetical protein
MAATLALVAFVFGEWIPTVTHQPIRLGFGPFMTMGPALYLLWGLGTLVILANPRLQRPVAMICVIATLFFVPVSDALRYGRPPMLLLVILIGLGLPSVLAPSPEFGNATKGRSLVIACVVVATTLSFLNEVGSNVPYRGGVFYWQGFRELAFWMPIIAVGVLMLIGAALVMRRRDLAGTIAILALPWALVGSWDPFGVSTAEVGLPESTLAINTALCALLGAGLAVNWITDLHRSPGSGAASGGRLDGSLNLGS